MLEIIRYNRLIYLDFLAIRPPRQALIRCDSRTFACAAVPQSNSASRCSLRHQKLPQLVIELVAAMALRHELDSLAAAGRAGSTGRAAKGRSPTAD